MTRGLLLLLLSSTCHQETQSEHDHNRQTSQLQIDTLALPGHHLLQEGVASS